jgi:hypothetical protein
VHVCLCAADSRHAQAGELGGCGSIGVQRALLELRHIEGQDELEEKLLLELRRLQRASNFNDWTGWQPAHSYRLAHMMRIALG